MFKRAHNRAGQSQFSGRPKTCAEIGHLRRAFTLTELLMVLAIIGIMGAMVLPHLKGLTEANVMDAASRQLVDDLGYARQRAINDHTTVYMVFLPGEFWNAGGFPGPTTPSGTNADNLINGQFTSYALFSFRTVGDQPGDPASQKYLTSWKTLPEGVFIDTNKFRTDGWNTNFFLNGETNISRNFTNRFFPFPPVELTNAVPYEMKLPYVAFNSQGQLISTPLGEDECIRLLRGSVFFVRDSVTDRYLRQPPDIELKDDGILNLVRINRTTGRAKLIRPELQ